MARAGSRIESRGRANLICPTLGDVIVQRRDGIYAYHLAVVVDDATQGITDVVRGADLLSSTPWQLELQRRLGFARPATRICP